MASAPPPDVVKGHLVLTVEEASGKNQKDQFTWETAVGTTFEAFVKVELRGGARNVKAQTKKAPLIGELVTWGEDLSLELLEGANELRLMLCREKFQGTKRGTSVIAACGIFVTDILEAVPIDKYFELFKPNAGGDGGYIRIRMNFVRDLAELNKPAAAASPRALPATEGQVAEAAAGSSAAAGKQAVATKQANKQVVAWVAGFAVAAAAAIFFGVTRSKKNQDKKKKN